MSFGLSAHVSVTYRFKQRPAATVSVGHCAEKERQLRDLMLRSLNGDASAYRSLLGGLVPVLTEFFSEKSGAPANNLDTLIQETLRAVHDRRQTYCRERSFLVWIYAIAGYKLSEHRENGARKF